MRYEGFAVSERGYQHILNGTVCQESVQYVQDMHCAAAAAADGHGSRQYFRSDRGSFFAAEISCSKIREFLHSDVLAIDDAREENKAVTQLVHSIITDWHIAVRNDLIKYPLTKDEMQKVPEKYIAEYSIFSEEKADEYKDDDLREIVQNEHSHIQKAYGTTLLAVGICDKYAIALHIGDGKCVALYEDGSMDEPVPWDENCHLNRCTSMCDRNAAKEFRFYIWKEKIPAAIFIGTDGIDDTFAAMLHTFYRNAALDFLQQDFRGSVESLQNRLGEISRAGSRDDVSIAGVIDIQKIREMETKLKLTAELESAVSQKKRLLENDSELKFRAEKLQRLLLQYRIKAESGDEEAAEKAAEYEEKCAAAEKEYTLNQEKLCTAEKLIAQLQSELESTVSSEKKVSDNADEPEICTETTEKSGLLISENEDWEEEDGD